ncbi:hypothetical protein BDF20DRAFT_839734 [Mycotypha africana]|uniref:uncharacterized protein n=1 Tax=Mycotypha africana TaxID=64632 RepID=UPI00230002AF|nr:uncharacterized protein BDF20DRAFT_839734 [Mycotypha africana]KAI8967894.1 hypothetical protein BDF20DRAFT_839734 [Mycotypha africana]
MKHTGVPCHQHLDHMQPFSASAEHSVNHESSVSTYALDPYNYRSFPSTPGSASTDHSFGSLCSAFSQTIISDSQTSSSFIEHLSDQYNINEEEYDEEEEEELNAPSYETILFYEILKEFPDLATFICHNDFNTFSQIWLELQRQKDLARYPTNRMAVQAWLKATALQIHFNLVTLVKSNPANSELNSEPRRMFSAWRRLKDRVEVTHQIIRIVEDRRVSYNQTPKEAITDLQQAAAQLNDDLNFFKQNPSIVPIIDEKADCIRFKPTEQVSITELTRRTAETYNLMSYDHNASLTPRIKNNTNLISEDRQILLSKTSLLTAPYYPVTGSTPEAEESVFIDNESYVPKIQECNQAQNSYTKYGLSDIDSRVNQALIDDKKAKSSPSPPVCPYVHPLQILVATSQNAGWSLPVTPQTEATQQQLFISLPSSPAAIDVQHRNSYIFAPCNSTRDEAMSPATSSIINSPLNTLSEDSLDYQFIDCDLVTPRIEEKEFDYERSVEIAATDTSITPTTTVPSEEIREDLPEEDGYQLQEDDVDKNMKTMQHRQRKSARAADPKRSSKKKKLNLKDLRNMIPVTRNQTRRTATSYDAETTHYLKSVFYNVYSQTNKLTKEQRYRIQKETGLKSRNITYWFSNHKRRFHESLKLFRKVVEQSEGRVKTYDDFLSWRRSQGLPEEIMENEMIIEEF